jgi:hypothetical protein
MEGLQPQSQPIHFAVAEEIFTLNQKDREAKLQLYLDVSDAAAQDLSFRT